MALPAAGVAAKVAAKKLAKHAAKQAAGRAADSAGGYGPLVGKVAVACLAVFSLLGLLVVGGLTSVAGAVLNSSQEESKCGQRDEQGMPPSAVAVNQIPSDYLALYQQAGESSGISWQIIAGVGFVESKHGTSNLPGVHSAQNFAGAAGPMQIGIGGKASNTWGGRPVRKAKPKIRWGVDGDGDGWAKVYDPADAIHAAAGILKYNYAQLGDMDAAIGAYNAGLGNAKKYGGVPPFAAGYVAEVRDAAEQYTRVDEDGNPMYQVADPTLSVICGAVDAYPPGGGAGPWGGHQNGRIPLLELCRMTDGQPAGSGDYAGTLARCDAAMSWSQMNQAYRAEFGHPIPSYGGYRDYAGQVAVRASWCAQGACNMAATPGTSNHGWGLAVDMTVSPCSTNHSCGLGTAHYKWLFANGPRFGWHNPPWAQKKEYWHFEFGGLSNNE